MWYDNRIMNDYLSYLFLFTCETMIWGSRYINKYRLIQLMNIIINKGLWFWSNCSHSFIVIANSISHHFPDRTLAYSYFCSLQLRLSITSDEVRKMSFQRDQRALRLVLAMNVGYLLCWCPYATVCIIHIFISKR